MTLLTWSALIGIAMCLCRCLLAQPVRSFLLARLDEGVRPIIMEHSFLNGPSEVSQQLSIPFYTHGIETQNLTWIDHILQFSSADNIDIMGAYNSQVSEWEGVSDHRPIWAHYNMAGLVTDHPVKPQKVVKRPEIPLHDPRQVDAFQRPLHDFF